MKITDINVEKREKLGSAQSRRHCRAGEIPCVLYGGKQESVPLLLRAEDFENVMRAHSALVRLALGDAKQTAIVRDVTWDTFGEYVQHVDLLRVEMADEIRIEVPMHFLGVPAGASHGGVLHVIHKEIPIMARVDAIPNELTFDVSPLDLGARVTMADLAYPEHVRPALPDDELVAHVKEPHIAEVETPDEAAEDETPDEAPADASDESGDQD